MARSAARPRRPRSPAMAGRFEMHAKDEELVWDEARKMWASSQNVAGAGCREAAAATSTTTRWAR